MARSWKQSRISYNPWPVCLSVLLGLPRLQPCLIPSSWHFPAVAHGWSSQRRLSLALVSSYSALLCSHMQELCGLHLDSDTWKMCGIVLAATDVFHCEETQLFIHRGNSHIKNLCAEIYKEMLNDNTQLVRSLSLSEASLTHLTLEINVSADFHLKCGWWTGNNKTTSLSLSVWDWFYIRHQQYTTRLIHNGRSHS